MTYAPLTISAVNHTTGVFTCVGHDLLTGGGFGAFPRGPSWGGALYAPAGGIIPTGLAPVTTYWPIRVDADHFKLASSNANAMSGTALSFSTDGALPIQFLVGLPYELPRTSVVGTQIFSDDNMTTWQSLKALWALLSGQSQAIWSTIVVALTVTFNALVTFAAGATAAPNQHITVSGTGKYKHGVRTLTVPVTGPLFGAVGPVVAPANATVSGLGSGGNNAVIQIPLHVGQRIVALRAVVTDSATGPTQVKVTLSAVNDGSIPANGATSSGSGAQQTLSVTGLTTTVLTGAYYFALFFNTTGTATVQISHLEVDYDQP